LRRGNLLKIGLDRYGSVSYSAVIPREEPEMNFFSEQEIRDTVAQAKRRARAVSINARDFAWSIVVTDEARVKLVLDYTTRPAGLRDSSRLQTSVLMA
jgi:hypothetical protein